MSGERIILTGLMADPQNWFMSAAVGDDFAYASEGEEPQADEPVIVEGE